MLSFPFYNSLEISFPKYFRVSWLNLRMWNSWIQANYIFMCINSDCGFIIFFLVNLFSFSYLMVIWEYIISKFIYCPGKLFLYHVIR